MGESIRYSLTSCIVELKKGMRWESTYDIRTQFLSHIHNRKRVPGTADRPPTPRRRLVRHRVAAFQPFLRMRMHWACQVRCMAAREGGLTHIVFDVCLSNRGWWTMS
jgi:hypothetical protein